MTNDRITYGLPLDPPPTPEELERAMERAAHLRARVFRDLTLAFGAWLARIDRERKLEPRHAA